MHSALLLDLDGTLIDSMPIHHEAWLRWHARRGLPIDAERFFAATAGRSNAEILADLLPGRGPEEHLVMAEEKEQIYGEIAQRSLALIAGAQSFVAAARAAGYGLAVCTAAPPANIALAVERFGIDGWVDTVISPADHASADLPGRAAGQALRGKPHPDIFLEAAQRLGVAPADCTVVEDAPLGIEAARRAGMCAVALTTTLDRQAFAGFDNVIAIAADFTALAPTHLKRQAPTHA